MGPQFHESGYGRRFFEGQLPQLIKQLTRIADALEKQNELSEPVYEEREICDDVLKDIKNLFNQ